MTDAGTLDGLEPVIGLEIHVQLGTRTKLFCEDEVRFAAQPNTQVCPVCLGLPGALPVLNRAAIDLAVRAALALGCTVHGRSVFVRKNYFYPDLPKGYQITQFDQPLATGGSLVADGPAEESPVDVRIRRVHLEEDAGRSVHDRVRGATAIDFNRAGVPLVEIVTEPDLRSPAAARAFLERLRQTLRYTGVSDCDMEKGSLRVDANISVRVPGDARPGVKTELKNMNSFAHVERALQFELTRQARLVRSGAAVLSETLLWDADRGEARALRAKEEARDYRYFAEPDLPPVVIGPAAVARLRDALPELPARKETRFRTEYELPAYDVHVLTADAAVADYFEAVARDVRDAKAASNWVMRDVLGWLNAHGGAVGSFPVSAGRLAALIRRVLDGTVSQAAARRVLERMMEVDAPADVVIRDSGLAQVTDDTRIEDWVDAVLGEFPQEVARFRDGDTRVLDYLMGQLMRRSGGRADPRRASELLRARMDA